MLYKDETKDIIINNLPDNPFVDVVWDWPMHPQNKKREFETKATWSLYVCHN